MPLPPINGYNRTFTVFVNFAQEHFDAGEKKAIANIETTPLGKRKIVASTTDGVGLAGMFRTKFEEGANNATRDIFLKAVARMFGGKSKIPESVWDALNLQDYGRGQPLTARRILAVKAAVDAHLSAPPDKLDVEVGGKTVTFEKWHYESLVAAMPKEQRPRGLAGRDQLATMLRDMLSERIGKGLKILSDVRAGLGAMHAASAKNVADLTLALHAIALSNGDKLPNGSFSVADPDGALAKWLDTSDEVYLRKSTHLEAYQKMTVDGHRNILRGIDVPDTGNGLLAGMRTVHYGTIPDLKTPNGNGPNRRLFLKCESYGCYHNPLSKADEAAGLTPNMRPRQSRDGDWSETIHHTFSYFETRGADPNAGGARKEHMTAGMKSAIQRAVQKLKTGGRADLAEQITSRNVKKGGSALLFDNLFKAVDAEPENALLREVVNDLIAAAKADIGDKHGTAIARLGNEVMVDENDISAFAPSSPLQIKGAGAQQITDVVLKNSDLKGDPDAASKLKTRMNAIATAELTTHIADQIGVKLRNKDGKGAPFIDLGKTGTAFDKDIMRDTGWTINGQAVPKDPKVARDMLARFVSGDDNATFDGADDALKTKVHVLMGCMHQGVSACALESVGYAFTETTGSFANLGTNVHPNGGNKTQSFALTKDAEGNILIDHKVHFTGGALLQLNDGDKLFMDRKTDKNGGVDYGVKITIPKADLDRFGTADWTQYDATPVTDAVGDRSLPNRFTAAAERVPEKFRFTGTVDVTCEIRANSLHDLTEEL